ncbi:MAG: hypothetical protein ACFE8E_14960 [Candidatus Hodarchaeota archaeon]
MSSGKIIENFQIKINNVLDYSPIDINVTSNPLVSKPKGSKMNLRNILFKIYEIHWVLKTNSDLSNKQRLDYCKVERSLMIEYLKLIVNKV